MAKNVLDLDTLTARDTVTVDGAPYDLANAGELSVLDNYRVGKWGERVKALYDRAEDLAEEEVAELVSLLDKLCRVIFRAPDAVHARLSDAQRLKVMTVFSELQRPAAPTTEEARDAVGAGPSTGENK